MNRVPRLIPSICAMTLLIGGCSTDHATSPRTRARAPLAPSPAISKPTTVAPPSPRNGRWVAELTNPWLGFEVGKVFHYRAETPDGIETAIVEVTAAKKMIQGVSTTVVRDQVFLDGSLIEDTYDWYAEDSEGTVWYFGEDSKQYDPVDGHLIGTEGSWEAGVDGARRGIIMPADPKVGMSYAQEDAPGIAEDHARIRSLSASVEVPYGRYDNNCLAILEWTPLDRQAREYKFYARGVGLLLVLEDKRRVRNELMSIEP